MSKLLLKWKQFLLKLFFAVVFARLLDFFAQGIEFSARLVEFVIRWIRFFSRLRRFIMNRSHIVVKAIVVAIFVFSVVYYLFHVFDVNNMKVITLPIIAAMMSSVDTSIVCIFWGTVIIAICAFFGVSYYANVIVSFVVSVIVIVILSTNLVEASMYRTIAIKFRMQATGYRLKYGTRATKNPAVKCHTQLIEYCIQHIMCQISENEHLIRYNEEVAWSMGWDELLLQENGYLLNLQGHQPEERKELYASVNKHITAKNHYLTLLDHFPSIVVLREEIKRIKGWVRLQSKAEEGEIKSICPNPSETITLLKLVLDYLESLCPRAILSEILQVMDLRIMVITKP
jgi:hypothetical protein